MKYIRYFLALSAALSLSACVHRMDTKKIGKITAISSGTVVTVDAVVSDQTTPWDLSLRTSDVSPADTLALSSAKVTLYLENAGPKSLRAFTSESLLASVPDKSVRFDVPPGGKVLLFEGSAADLIKYSRNISFQASSARRETDKLAVRFHLISQGSFRLDGEIVVNVINYDSI